MWFGDLVFSQGRIGFVAIKTIPKGQCLTQQSRTFSLTLCSARLSWSPRNPDCFHNYYGGGAGCWLLKGTPWVTHVTYTHISWAKARHMATSNFKGSGEMQSLYLLGRRGNWMFWTALVTTQTCWIWDIQQTVGKARPNNLEVRRQGIEITTTAMGTEII